MNLNMVSLYRSMLSLGHSRNSFALAERVARLAQETGVISKVYGDPTHRQLQRIRRHVRGHVVHDLGAGPSCVLSHVLLSMGAQRVIAVDQEPMRAAPEISRKRVLFKSLTDPIDVAFVSWPINQENNGLVECLQRANTVIYLGKNTDGMACGGIDFWIHVTTRRVVEHLPSRNNVLLVYGGKTRPRRLPRLLPEERAAVTQEHLKYSEIYP